MKKLALLLMLLGAYAQGAMATVTVSWAGNNCQLPAHITFTASVTGMTSPSYQWNVGGMPGSLQPTCNYIFSGPGVYLATVVVTDVNGNTDSGSVSVPIMASCMPPVTLTGRLYEDLNGNCVYDAGEPGQSGIYVAANGNTGPAYAGALSDAQGLYTITVFYDTSYTLTVNTGQNFFPGCPDPAVAVVNLPDTVHDFALIPVPMATLSGYLYNDENGNCTHESTEYGYEFPEWSTPPGLTYRKLSTYSYHPIPTDSNGYYSITLPADSTYILRVGHGLFAPNIVCPAADSVFVTLPPAGSTQDIAIASPYITLIKGHAYDDANANCVYDAGETTFPGRPISIQSINEPWSVTIYTDANGFYHIIRPNDSTYTLTINPGTALNATCPATGEATHTLTGTTIVQDFALSCIPATDPWDLGAGGYSNNYNPWITRQLWPFLFNTQGSCMNQDAILKLSLHPALIYQSTSYDWQPDYIIGQDLYWYINAGSVIDFADASVSVLADNNLAAMGDTLCSTVAIIHDGAGDANAANDTAVICGVVTASFDPNDKAVSPQGVGPQGYLPAMPQPLSYLIRFQNTGTDTAYNIVVRDTLSAAMDWSTLKVLNASHPINMTQGAGGAVAFNFPNILLPDSNVNEAASHGFVAYSVKMLPSLAPGTPIANTAYIYFDNNAAVVTNTVLNTIELQASNNVRGPRATAARIYPNPANTFVTVVAEGIGEAALSDVAGRALCTASGEGNLRLDVHALPEGLYWLKIKDARGTAVQQVRVAH